ncbi:MAG: DUF433 domain-containing protein [Chloroflexota bacterium]|nr:DUF433 domain-containing protein [Chloroflexota bacterium]
MSRVIPEQNLVISRDPEVMGGTPVFAGTRVPVQALIDGLAAGSSIEEFRQGYPRVTREQIAALLSQISDILSTARV